MARMIVVDRDGKEHEIEAKPGLKVMEILRELDYGVAAICGGLCSCATCHVYVDESWAGRLPKPQSDELELLKELPDYRDATSRLSCQVDFTEALSGIKVSIAPDTQSRRTPSRAGHLALFGLPAYRILRRCERGRVAQEPAADRLDLLVEFVQHRYARGNVELDDVALGHHVEHLDQGAERIAVRHDQNVLSGAQFGNNSGLPKG